MYILKVIAQIMRNSEEVTPSNESKKLWSHNKQQSKRCSKIQLKIRKISVQKLNTKGLSYLPNTKERQYGHYYENESRKEA